MRRRTNLKYLLKPVSAILLGIATVVMPLGSGKALATPASGFSGKTLAQGLFDEFDVINQRNNDLWQSKQKTKGRSDVYVQFNSWDPGGTTGWHTHPGHSLIIVTSGTLTYYEGSDPGCKPHELTPGMGYVDLGGDHVHIVRNEGSVTATGYAVQLIQAGATRRIDAPGPGNCPF